MATINGFYVQEVEAFPLTLKDLVNCGHYECNNQTVVVVTSNGLINIANGLGGYHSRLTLRFREVSVDITITPVFLPISQ